MVKLLDVALKPADFEDASHNGLQVSNSGTVKRVATGVDASMAFFEKAAEAGADLLVCHHGLSWGDSLKRINGLNYRRLKFLMDHDMALYACHLPLDAHPRLGNNVRICRELKLADLKPFGDYHGMTIGFRGRLTRAIPYASFIQRVERVMGKSVMRMDFGRPTVQRVGVISGGAADEVEQAAAAGLDVYLSGEPKLSAWHLAQEYGIHAIFAGHYATEVFGVKAVAAWLKRRTGIEARFIDLNVPF